MGAAVLDSPLQLLAPRPIRAGWHLAPAGVCASAPIRSAPRPIPFNVGAGGPPLISKEGIGLVAEGTIRYRVDRIVCSRCTGP